MYVDFMKNFLRADSRELKAVRLILASWAQKQLIPTFVDMMYVEFMKNFLLADSSELMIVKLIWHPEPKNKWFLLCRHDVRRVHEKFSSRRFDRSIGCYTHFGILSPKTSDSYFVDMMYVEFMKNFLLADSSELMAVRLIWASWDQKQVIPTW